MKNKKHGIKPETIRGSWDQALLRRTMEIEIGPETLANIKKMRESLQVVCALEGHDYKNTTRGVICMRCGCPI